MAQHLTYHSAKLLEYLICSSLRSVSEEPSKEYIIRFGIAHFLWWRGRQRVVSLLVFKFMFVTAVELHPRRSGMVRCLGVTINIENVSP